jgi:hypothetical protein
MNVYSISSTPYYDATKETYINIIKINTRPIGPLSTRIKILPSQRISSFSIKTSHFTYAILAENSATELMQMDNITELFDFLSINNYQIDTSLTDMMRNREFNINSTLICFIRWNSVI